MRAKRAFGVLLLIFMLAVVSVGCKPTSHNGSERVDEPLAQNAEHATAQQASGERVAPSDQQTDDFDLTEQPPEPVPIEEIPLDQFETMIIPIG